MPFVHFSSNQNIEKIPSSVIFSVGKVGHKRQTRKLGEKKKKRTHSFGGSTNILNDHFFLFVEVFVSQRSLLFLTQVHVLLMKEHKIISFENILFCNCNCEATWVVVRIQTKTYVPSFFQREPISLFQRWSWTTALQNDLRRMMRIWTNRWNCV